ncbi:amidohydrolase [Ferrovibrio sp.]|uniref:amidohydrolase family protein n=1 Tax=Ferrovibrio sp. TaxID=1917215 RepID=UPI000CB3EAE4|nr:amidohydrolase family protein [Ferrovibrio sp.]PJI38775.1 MAG: hypothetical protein CTR53_16110 [Ferrovibrio sp.]
MSKVRLVIDSQVHLVPRNTPERPWRSTAETFHGYAEFGVGRLLDEMDAAGVDHAIVVPTSAVDGTRNDYALAAAQAHPKRLSVVGLFDMRDVEATRTLLRGWREVKGLVGLRAVFRHAVGDSAQWLADGTADWFWPEAENAGIPLYIHAPGQVRRLAAVAERHPDLRMVIDHLGMSADVQPGEIDGSISDVISLARYMNVSAKASALSTITPSKFPADRLKERMKELLGAYGSERIFWGSDITRVTSYLHSIDLFRDAVSFLGTRDMEMVMGRSLAAWLDASMPTTVWW